MRRIVVGYDGSDDSKRALEWVGRFAPEGAEVRIASVAEFGPPPIGVGVASYDEREINRDVNAKLETGRRILADAGVEARTIALDGDPAAALVKLAEDTNAELIVVGTRGMSQFGRLLVGSVSTKLVHHAPCAVLVVR